MKFRVPRNLPAIVCATVLSGIPSAIIGSPAGATPQVPPPAPSDDIAVVSLARDFQIPLQEAADRIGWQWAAVPAVPAIAQYLGASYGGAWFDTNGRFHVGVVPADLGSELATTVTPDSIPAIASADLSSVTDVTVVRWPEAELERVTTALAPDIVNVNRDASVHISLRTVAPKNAVEIVAGTGQLTVAQMQFISSAEAQFGSRVVRSTVPGSNVTSPDACDSPQGCDPPLRAGLEIDGASITKPNCTSGPIVRSNTDNKLYVLTSGHCLNASGLSATWNETFSNGEVHHIGAGWHYLFGGSDDGGIIAINNPAPYPVGWGPRAEILVQASFDTTYDPTYAVSGTGGSTFGMRICKAGAFHGTSCGQVIGLNAVADNGITGLGQADYFGGSGDSGGPTFSGHIVYGIHESHSGTDPSSTTCYYVGISRATAMLNVRVSTGT
jgi:streptogrisin C